MIIANCYWQHWLLLIQSTRLFIVMEGLQHTRLVLLVVLAVILIRYVIIVFSIEITLNYKKQVDGTTYGSTRTFSVVAGEYTYYVKDSNGCVTPKTFTITQNPGNIWFKPQLKCCWLYFFFFLVLQATANAIPSCFAGSNGVITFDAIGGTGDYSYEVSDIQFQFYYCYD